MIAYQECKYFLFHCPIYLKPKICLPGDLKSGMGQNESGLVVISTFRSAWVQVLSNHFWQDLERQA